MKHHHNHQAVDGSNPPQIAQAARWNRRGFVKGVGALASSAGLLAYDFRSAAAEPPPEITRLRLIHSPAICLAPQYLAEDLLRLEGFSEVRYVTEDMSSEPDNYQMLTADKADLTMDGVTALVPALDAGNPIVVLAGVHGGCYELFANERIRTIRDLKGKRIAITARGAAEHTYIASMMAYVGMDPRRDSIDWVETHTFDQPMQLFVDGKVDAFLGFPPQPQQVRAKKIGHVIVDTSKDHPWSQYFCCMVAGRQEFVSKYPVATKRAVRAILKAADVCAREPERAARYMVKKGYEASYDIAQVVKEVSYNAWRVFDPTDTLRFHALRLHEVGMVKTDPSKLIAQGTNWRFLNELKHELKA